MTMELLTLEEAKTYLRVDSGLEDGLISTLYAGAVALCRDVARLTQEEWENHCSVQPEPIEPATIRGMVVPVMEMLQMREQLKVAVLYALAYLFEHREEADHHDLVLTLRSLLFSIREGCI